MLTCISIIFPSTKYRTTAPYVICDSGKVQVSGTCEVIFKTKAFEKSGIPQENNLLANRNPVHLAEGVHFIHLSKEESRQHLIKVNLSKASTGPPGARHLLAISDPTPKLAAPASLAPNKLQEAAVVTPKSITFEGLLNEDFSFLDPYLVGDAGTSISGVVEPQAPQEDNQQVLSSDIERTVTSNTEKTDNNRCMERSRYKEYRKSEGTEEGGPIS